MFPGGVLLSLVTTSLRHRVVWILAGFLYQLTFFLIDIIIAGDTMVDRLGLFFALFQGKNVEFVLKPECLQPRHLS